MVQTNQPRCVVLNTMDMVSIYLATLDIVDHEMLDGLDAVTTRGELKVAIPVETAETLLGAAVKFRLDHQDDDQANQWVSEVIDRIKCALADGLRG